MSEWGEMEWFLGHMLSISKFKGPFDIASGSVQVARGTVPHTHFHLDSHHCCVACSSLGQ